MEIILLFYKFCAPALQEGGSSFFYDVPSHQRSKTWRGIVFAKGRRRFMIFFIKPNELAAADEFAAQIFPPNL